MYQQAAIFAIEGLEKYDSSKPLENFLWTHLRNRLFNFKRDNFKRPDKPCLNCPLYDKDYAVSDNQCSKYSQVLDCSLYKKWYIRNSSKQNIMKPTSLENEKVVSSGAGSIFGDISNSELLNKIEKELRGEYREIYLKIKHGTKVNRADIKKVTKIYTGKHFRMPKKRGQLSLEEEKFIQDNVGSMSVEAIAEYLNRNTGPVEKYIKENQIFGSSDEQKFIRHFKAYKLHGKTFWGRDSQTVR